MKIKDFINRLNELDPESDIYDVELISDWLCSKKEAAQTAMMVILKDFYEVCFETAFCVSEIKVRRTTEQDDWNDEYPFTVDILLV